MSSSSDNNQAANENKKTRNRKRRLSLSTQTRPSKRSVAAHSHAGGRLITDVSNDVLSEIVSYLDVLEFQTLYNACDNPASLFNKKLLAVMSNVRYMSVSLKYPHSSAVFSPVTHWNIRLFLALFTKLETMHIMSEDSVWDFTTIIPSTVTSVITNCPLSHTSMMLMKTMDGLHHLVHLEVATLSSAPGDIDLLAKHLPVLQSLNVSAFDRVSLSGLSLDLSGFKSLRHLGVATIHSDTLIRSFFIFPSRLESLALLKSAATSIKYSVECTDSVWQNMSRTLLALEHLQRLVIGNIFRVKLDVESFVDSLLSRDHFKHLLLPNLREWIRNEDTGRWHYFADDVKTLKPRSDVVPPYEMLRPTIGLLFARPVCHPLQVALKCYVENNPELARYVLRPARITMYHYCQFYSAELATFLLCDTVRDGEYASCHWLGIALACTSHQTPGIGYDECTRKMVEFLSTVFQTLKADSRPGGLGKQRLARLMTSLYLVHATPPSKRSKTRPKAICALLSMFGFDESTFLERTNVRKCSYARNQLLIDVNPFHPSLIPPSPYLVSHILDGLMDGSLVAEKKKDTPRVVNAPV